MSGLLGAGRLLPNAVSGPPVPIGDVPGVGPSSEQPTARMPAMTAADAVRGTRGRMSPTVPR